MRRCVRMNDKRVHDMRSVKIKPNMNTRGPTQARPEKKKWTGSIMTDGGSYHTNLA